MNPVWKSTGSTAGISCLSIGIVSRLGIFSGSTECADCSLDTVRRRATFNSTGWSVWIVCMCVLIVLQLLYIIATNSINNKKDIWWLNTNPRNTQHIRTYPSKTWRRDRNKTTRSVFLPPTTLLYVESQSRNSRRYCCCRRRHSSSSRSRSRIVVVGTGVWKFLFLFDDDAGTSWRRHHRQQVYVRGWTWVVLG